MNTMETDLQTGIRLMRVLAFTMVISVMNATMFNIVLPQMREELGISVTQVSWVFSFYTLFYAIGVAIFGKLADKYRLKSLLTFGLAVLAIGSLTGLSAQTFWMVIAGRILQAAGASIIPVMAMLIPIRYFPPENRGRALGISATGLALGNAIGPVVSALVVGTLHWRWLFAIPLLMIFMLPFYRKYLTDEQPKGGVGMGLLSMINFLSGTISTLIYSKILDQGAEQQWNPFYSAQGNFMYSNIYLALFVLYIALLVIYQLYLRRHLITPAALKGECQS
ncbi:MFS transporter [Paenibacillus enshidis]|uniref:MFS transporter n=1 Tax=Paenibacillus enshidis TaxID=1458439 RepID=A0ABV5B2H1_9BACL